jgi:hypothetical protein
VKEALGLFVSEGLDHIHRLLLIASHVKGNIRRVSFGFGAGVRPEQFRFSPFLCRMARWLKRNPPGLTPRSLRDSVTATELRGWASVKAKTRFIK